MGLQPYRNWQIAVTHQKKIGHPKSLSDISQGKSNINNNWGMNEFLENPTSQENLVPNFPSSKMRMFASWSVACLGRAEVREGFSQRMRWKHRRWKQCRGFTLGCRGGGCGRGWNINRLNSNPQKDRKMIESEILHSTKVLVSHSFIIFYPFVCEVATAWLQTLKCQIHFHRFLHIFRHRDSVGWGMERAQGQLNQRGAGAVMCKTSSPVSLL